jgi:hypothetical protein
LANALKVKHVRRPKAANWKSMMRFSPGSACRRDLFPDDDRKLAHAAVAKTEYVKQQQRFCLASRKGSLHVFERLTGKPELGFNLSTMCLL